MALDVDWAGSDPTNPHRIYVPRADMVVVQASPEIRELDMDVFRKELRTLEADVEGAPWPHTHEHVTEFTLSGVTYSRTVQIIPPYVVEFEDGNYGVRATGADQNLLDVKVANSVSFLGVLSAGRLVVVSAAAQPTQQEMRDAMKLAASAGAPAAGSLDAAHAQTQSDVAALASVVDLVVAYDVSTTTIKIKCWLVRSKVPSTTPTTLLVTWRDADGSVLFTLTESDATLDADGVYRASKVQALADDETYYVDVTVTDGSGPVAQRHGVMTASGA